MKRRATMTSQLVRMNNANITPLTKTPPMNRKKSSTASAANTLPAKTGDLLSVLEHGRVTEGISVGHIVEAIPMYVNMADASQGEYYLGEVVAIRQVETEGTGSRPFFYVHFLNEGPKLDDWLPLSHLRRISSTALLESRIRALGEPGDAKNFFALSSFSATSSNIHPRYHIKSIRGIQLGNQAVLKAWYPSPYPEMISCPDSYIKLCDTCLCYFKSADELSRHWKYCLFNHPPGNEIYRSHGDNHSVFEIDGEVHNGYCERLLLLAKLFLREKRACGQDASQYAQVRTFHFYVLCRWRSDGGRADLVGYFSKLKNNVRESNILSCILVLPHMQRRGYGNFLIDLSYELARIEGRIGSAERPLSELGQLTFYPYWLRKMAPVITRMLSTRNDLVIAELAQETGIIADDIVETLKYYALLKEWGSAGVVVIVTPEIVADLMTKRPVVGNHVLFEPAALEWTPVYSFNSQISTP